MQRQKLEIYEICIFGINSSRLDNIRCGIIIWPIQMGDE